MARYGAHSCRRTPSHGMRSWARGSLTWAGPGIVKSIVVRCTGSYDCHPGSPAFTNETHAPSRASAGACGGPAPSRGQAGRGGGRRRRGAPGRGRRRAPPRRGGAPGELAQVRARDRLAEPGGGHAVGPVGGRRVEEFVWRGAGPGGGVDGESLGRIEAVGRGEGVEGGLAPERRVGARVQLAMQLRLSGKEFSQRYGGEGSGVGSMPGFAASRAVTSLAEAGRGRCGTHRVADPDRYRLA